MSPEATGVAGGGGGRRRRVQPWRSIHPVSNDSADDHPDAGNSEWNSMSSDHDVLNFPRRNKALDDALFGFFSKQAVKSLKKNFSRFYEDSSFRHKGKKSKVDGAGRHVFSRFSVKYYHEVMKNLTPYQRAVIQKFRFGCLLMYEKCEFPSEFARWVADYVDPVCSQTTIGGKPIPISKHSVHHVLGLPINGAKVPCSSNDGRNFILSHFQLTSMPHITFFGNKLKSPEDLSDHDIFVCFMVVAMSCFLCPSSKECPNSKYLAVLQDPKAAGKYDFCKLVHECILEGITEFSMKGKVKGQRLKTPFCCNYFLLVQYLDCLDFGMKTVDQTVPRISVWKGNMIKVFSELDRKGVRRYGKRHLKEDLASSYQQGITFTNGKDHTSHDAEVGYLDSEFRQNVHSLFTSDLRPEVIDGIFNIAQSFVSDKSKPNKRKMEALVINVFEFLRETRHILKSDACKCPVKKQDISTKPSLAEACKVAPSGKISSPRIVQLDLQDLPDPATPECVITKVVESYSLMTAPNLEAVKKVKARTCQLISTEEEQALLNRGLCLAGANDNQKDAQGRRLPNRDVPPLVHNQVDADLNDVFINLSPTVNDGFINVSPITRINLFESPCEKRPCTANYNIKRVNPEHPLGTKQAPIVVTEAVTNASMDGCSPDVKIVGSTNFNIRRNELSKKIDITYNKMMLPTVSHQQRVNAPSPLQARRKYRLVNWLIVGLIPPLQHNARFPVSDDDIIHYSAIVELAHSRAHKKTLGVLYPKVHCNYQSLGESLMPKGLVDNFLIPCFCRMLFEDRHPVASGRHYFFSHIGENILKFHDDDQARLIKTSFEGAAKASRGRKLGQSDRLFFPICEGRHWFLFVVDFQYRVFAFLDSLYTKDSDFHAHIKDAMINNFSHLWELTFKMKEPNFDVFQVMYPNVPRQHNLLDCGVYSMKFMEIWEPTIDLRTKFSKDDILNIRIQYANQLYFSNQNSADLSLVTDFYAEG